MIGDKVKVTIFGKINDKIHSARITSDHIHMKNAYVVSRREISDYFDGIVIATATFDGLNEERAIVAPVGDVFYEPQICTLLSTLKNVTLKRINCLYEKSCGGVVFYKTSQSAKILLVKNNNGRYWSFPKGHIEKGENEKQTAIREIKEETGLDVTLYDGFREISEYCPFGRIRKRVVFFLARTYTDRVKIQEEEIDSYIWVDLSKAKNLCSYDNDLRIIEKAEQVISLIKN